MLSERNMTKLRQQKQSSAALSVVIRIWIVTLAILAVPALGGMIVGLGQCKQSACSTGTSQTARYVGR
jgi:hypothetical protein